MSTSEERSLPASKRKLDKARQKGDVAQPGDIIMATSLTAAVMLFWTRPDLALGGWSEVTVVTLNSAMNPDFFATASRLSAMLADQALRILIPLLAISVGTKIIVNIIVHRGFIFSVEPLTLKFERLNPGQNLKQMFSAQTGTMLGKTLVKLILMASVLGFVVITSVGALVHAPACGLRCSVEALLIMAKTVLMVALPLLLLIGFADVQIQNWLYLKRQRMTKTEAKRERKEQDGSPQIKQAQRTEMARMMREAAKGLKKATIVIAGGGVVVGLRYVPGETGLPILVWKPNGIPAQTAIAAARAAGVFVFMDAPLAKSLRDKLKMGEGILDEHFTGVATVVNASTARNG
jgi:type III secretion protein U